MLHVIESSRICKEIFDKAITESMAYKIWVVTILYYCEFLNTPFE